MDSIHTDQLQTKTVRQLRQLCKAQRIKNYAWASKIELIFLLLDLTTECICCEDKLTSEEMATYLENQEGGDNCWIDDEQRISWLKGEATSFVSHDAVLT